MRLVDLTWGGGTGQTRVKVRGMPLVPWPHNCVLESAHTSFPRRAHKESRWWSHWELPLEGGVADLRFTGKWGKWPLPHSCTTQHWHPLSLPKLLLSDPSNGLFCRARASQGRMIRRPEGRAIAFPEADAVRRAVLHPREMVSAMWEKNSTQGSWWLTLQLSS